MPAAGSTTRTITTFTINFEPNQTSFSADRYGAEYQRVVEMADKYGNAVIAIRWPRRPHQDPARPRQGRFAERRHPEVRNQGELPVLLQGQTLGPEIHRTDRGTHQPGRLRRCAGYNPRQTMQAALNLSRKRAEAVRDSIISYGRQKGLNLDKSQIQAVGVGVREPFVAKPRNMNEAR